VRLLQASKAYAPHVGGIETVVRQVAEGHLARGYESEVLVAGASRSSVETVEGVTVTRVGSRATIASLPLAIGFPAAMARASADVLVVHEPCLLASASMLARPSMRRRFGSVVVWWHSDIHRQRHLEPIYGPILRSLLDSADRIVVATPHHITSSPFLPAYRSKVEVIPFGIRLAEYAMTAERFERVTAIREPNNGCNIVSVGRLVPYKGHRFLLDAVAELDGCYVTIIGDGPGRDEIVSHPTFRAGRVRLLPSMSKRAMIDQLHAADIFAFTSVHKSEAFGISQIEAMACGKPVVCFDLPTGVTWVNQDMVSGLVCELANTADLARSLRRLVENQGLRAELGGGAQRRAESVFDERTMLDEVEGLVSSLTSRSVAVRS
jgi:glycosyltransferase involved in cell wall biosynthesis